MILAQTSGKRVNTSIMTDTAQEQLLRNQRWLCFRMEQQVNQALSPLGVTAVQAQILLYLLDQPGEGVSLRDLHSTFDYSMPTLSEILKRLREKGYVQAERCCGDDRRKLLRATEKSQAVRDELQQTILHTEARLYDCLSREEMARLGDTQRKLMRHVSSLTEGPHKPCKKEAI